MLNEVAIGDLPLQIADGRKTYQCDEQHGKAKNAYYFKDCFCFHVLSLFSGLTLIIQPV